MDTERIANIKKVANEIRKLSLKTVYEAQCGHIGGSLSEAEIMAALYFDILKIDPNDRNNPNRDRFILSKGHCTLGYYSTLALRGFFQMEVMETFDKLDSILQAHPDMNKTPGVDMSSGSLGQGLSCGIGIALGATMDNQDLTTYVLMGDGELQEGQIWEAALYAGSHGIKRLIGIVDKNTVQLCGMTQDISDLGDLEGKWKAFGWNVLSCNGHCVMELLNTIEEAKRLSAQGPVAVICNTVKGKGISFMENNFTWHSKAPNKEEFEKGLSELIMAE
jgi:transketolase